MLFFWIKTEFETLSIFFLSYSGSYGKWVIFSGLGVVLEKKPRIFALPNDANGGKKGIEKRGIKSVSVEYAVLK
jgi:hypothetical protein